MRYGHWQSFNILWAPRRVLLRLIPLLPTNGAGWTALILRQILFQLVVIKGLADHVLIVGVEGLAVVVVAPEAQRKRMSACATRMRRNIAKG